MFDFDISKLPQASAGSTLEDLSFDINEYKSEGKEKNISDIVSFINTRVKAVNVPSDSLREGKELIQDSFEKYLSANGYNSSSFLKKALYTPRHYFFEKEFNPELRKYQNKKSFELGTFIHEAILEPTKFSRVFVEPSLHGVSKNSTEHHENLAFKWFEKVEESENPFIDKTCLSAPLKGLKRDEYKEYIYGLKAISMIESISEEDFIKIQAFKQIYDTYGNGIIPELLKHSKREVSLYYEDEETGLNVRIRPDALQFKENIGCNAIISLKSTSSENLGKFFYDCAKYHYDLSEAMYQDVASEVTGRKFDTTIMIMVQTVAPFGIAVIRWNQEDIATGRYKYRLALNNVLDFENNSVKSSYDTYSEEGNGGIIDSKLPDWNKKEISPRNFNL